MKEQKIKEIIEKNFLVKTDESGFLILTRKGTGKDRRLPPQDGTIFIMLENIPEDERTEENVPRLLKEGKIIKVKRWDLYKMFTDFTEEELYKIFYGYDKRTHKYLKAIEKQIGLLEHKSDYDEEEFEVLRQYSLFANLTGSGYVDVGKLKDGRYVAQFAYRVSIDDYTIEKIYFNHLPSKKDVRTAILISDIRTYFKLHPGTYEFRCWECGRKVHWLDIKAKDLEERFDRMQDRYCGC